VGGSLDDSLVILDETAPRLSHSTGPAGSGVVTIDDVAIQYQAVENVVLPSDLNDAPELEPSVTTLHSSANSTLIAPLWSLINAGPGSIVVTDADANDPVGGIAVTQTSGSGTFAYSLDGGFTYSNLVAPAPEAAVVLPAEAFLRYTATAVLETAALTFVAWDRSDVAVLGQLVDATQSGGQHACSSGVGSIHIDIQPEVGLVIDAGTPRVAEYGDADQRDESFAVRLLSQPAGSVIVQITSADNGAVTVSPAVLTFTPSDWDQPRSVTLSGVTDQVAEPAQEVAIRLSVASAPVDPGYLALSERILRVTVLDVPTSPTITGPFSEIETRTPTISWQPVAGATSYRVRLAEMQDPDVTILSTPAVTATSFQVPVTHPLASGEYAYFVSANNANGYSPWSGPHTFCVADPTAGLDLASAQESGGNGDTVPGVNPSGNVLANDSDIDAGGVLSVVGVARGVFTNPFYGDVGVPVFGLYGTLHVEANGDFTYLVDDDNPQVQSLPEHDLLVDEFSYMMSVAGELGAAVGRLRVLIAGANDSPTGILLSNDIVTENVAGAVVGTLAVIDADTGDTATFALTGDESGKFELVGNQLRLKPNQSLDYETMGSHVVAIRGTDSGGLFVEQPVTIHVRDVLDFTDTTAPVAIVQPLPLTWSSSTITLHITLDDPPGADGGVVSGVASFDLFVAVDSGGWSLFADDIPASETSVAFPAQSNHRYWFRAVATDVAGNREVELSPPPAETNTKTLDFDAPVTQVTLATVNESEGRITLDFSGTDSGGSGLKEFRVYVSIDGATPEQVVGSPFSAGTATNGLYSGALEFQGLRGDADKQKGHTYRFFSVGVDKSGNEETPPSDSEDQTVSVRFEEVPLDAINIDVQNGQTQRSFVQYVDVLFNNAVGLEALIDNGRVRVERFAINDTTPDYGTGSLVTGFTATTSGNAIQLDFGSSGLGGVKNAGNGFYRISLDMDNDGAFDDAHFEFFRLFGDANGDGKVDAVDQNAILEDLNGDGRIDSRDRRDARNELGKAVDQALLAMRDD
jgi:VCBS repeat-containing protein